MGKARALINKLKRRRRNSNKNRGFRQQDKIDRKDEILADSPGAYKYLRGIQRRQDSWFGQQTQPSAEYKPGKEFLSSADVTETDEVAGVAATATIDLTTDIVLTDAEESADRNTDTFIIQVLAAAANPTDTVLVDFTGTSDAVTCTVTPNDGTNNGATPVDLTTAELVELINTGSVSGKTITLTDASSLRALQTATGGDATALADAGEGDGQQGTFAGGVTPVSAGVSLQLASGLVRAIGAKVGDIVQVLEGTLKGKEYEVIGVNYSTDVITLQYEDTPLNGTESSQAIKIRISGTKNSFL